MTTRINKNQTRNVYLNDISNSDKSVYTYPGKLLVSSSLTSENTMVYTPRLYCTALIFLSEDESIGLCTCSRCGHTMNPFAKYCSNCGAKSQGRELANTSEDEG